jgi:5'-phosphate synthase pdxT subunit
LPRGSLKRIGVLACQGAFAEHLELLRQLDVSAFAVRLPQEIEGLDGLISPGGESTTISRLIQEYDLISPLTSLCRDGIPIMGTCAGMILLAKNVSNMDGVTPLGVMDIDIRRNAFGRQVDSFEVDIPIPAIGDPPFHCVFIRAPIIERFGVEVEVLARLPDDTVVAAKHGNAIALAFHPELTGDLRLHSYFLSIVDGGGNQ